MDLLPFFHMSACGDFLVLRGFYWGDGLGWQDFSGEGRLGARSASADEAYELLFDDHAGHALHFGEAAGEGGGGLVQRDDLLHGLFGQFLAGRGEKFHGFFLVARVQIPSQRAEQGTDPRAASVQARKDFWEDFVVEVRHPLVGFP